MCSTDLRNEKLKDAFLTLGCEYFSIARYSASQFYMPICATMFHHAIELLLKGFLIKRHEISELKKIGHKLVDLWNLFLHEATDKTITRFTTTIANLDRAEDLRYPELMVDEGFELNVGLGGNKPMTISKRNDIHKYYINVTEIDDIARAILYECSVNPKLYFHNTPSVFISELPIIFQPY